MLLLRVVLVGLAAGWILGKIRRGEGYGFFGNLIVGLIGSLVGWFLMGLLQIQAPTVLAQLAVAVAGAIVFSSYSAPSPATEKNPKKMKINRAALFSAVILLFAIAPLFSATKDSYVKKANQQLQDWNTKVDELQKRSQKAGAQTRAEFDQALHTVRNNLDIFRQKITDVQGSGEDHWKSFSQGADEAFKDVKHAYREATSYLERDKHKEK